MSFRSARVNAGLSVTDVMNALNVTDAAVYQWETGANIPKGSRLPEIAKLYDCTIDDLFREDESSITD